MEEGGVGGVEEGGVGGGGGNLTGERRGVGGGVNINIG